MQDSSRIDGGASVEKSDPFARFSGAAASVSAPSVRSLQVPRQTSDGAVGDGLRASHIDPALEATPGQGLERACFAVKGTCLSFSLSVSNIAFVGALLNTSPQPVVSLSQSSQRSVCRLMRQRQQTSRAPLAGDTGSLTSCLAGSPCSCIFGPAEPQLSAAGGGVAERHLNLFWGMPSTGRPGCLERGARWTLHMLHPQRRRMVQNARYRRGCLQNRTQESFWIDAPDGTAAMS